MLYPECMIIVTISEWHQFSSYQAALGSPSVAELCSAEFGEKKKDTLPTVAVPTTILGLPILRDRDG